MGNEFVVQAAIILLPICLYQMIASKQSFQNLLESEILLGVYGGLAGILDTWFPAHIFGVIEDFKYIPIILSILYGKRKAAFIAVGMNLIYEMIVHFLNIGIYGGMVVCISFIPFVVCHLYERMTYGKRAIALGLIVIATVMIEWSFISVALWLYPAHLNWITGLHFVKYFGVTIPTQLVLMWLAFLGIEKIYEDRRLRRQCQVSQRDLIVSQERFQSLFNYAPIGICAFDSRDTFMFANAAYEAITGYSVDELIGQTRMNQWLPQDNLAAEDVKHTAPLGETKAELETMLLHKTGRHIHVRFTNVPMVVSGEVVGYFGLVTDVTDERVAEEFMIKSEKLATVGQLAAGVAHEIRNPLTSLKGFLALLEDAASDDFPYFQIMQGELSRIDLISSQLLALAKPQADKFHPQNLNHIIQDVVNLMYSEALLSNVDIRVQLHFVDLVLGDEGQLKQIFINLIKNGIDAMHQGGYLTIITTMVDDSVHIQILDEGSGMDGDTLRRLGEPFYTTNTSGTGLGLMVTYRLLERHHARIRYDSVLGEGTTVLLTFPIYKTD